MFDMASYYREATRQEIEQFAASPGLLASPDVLDAVADTWMRRKITSVLANGLLTKETPQKIVEKAKEVGLAIDVQADGNGKPQIVFPADKKAQKLLLRFLDDDYLGSLLTQDRYMSNSKRRL